MTKRLLVAIIMLICLGLAGCEPRGESKSLDEVYKIAKRRYLAVKDVSVKDNAGVTLTSLVGELDKIESEQAAPADLAKKGMLIGGLLTDLAAHSAYTNRPQLGELAKQYFLFEQGQPNSAAVKLLVSRTYSLIASELETTKFQVS